MGGVLPDKVKIVKITADNPAPQILHLRSVYQDIDFLQDCIENLQRYESLAVDVRNPSDEQDGAVAARLAQGVQHFFIRQMV